MTLSILSSEAGKHFEAPLKIHPPLFTSTVSAGFPSPADDYIERHLDLNELLVKHPTATFFVRVEGQSMINAGIKSGDILIVDRSLNPSSGHVVIAVLNGEFLVKKLHKRGNQTWLLPENPKFQPMQITAEANFEIWGVVTSVIHNFL
jgi:DNA polymerase V